MTAPATHLSENTESSSYDNFANALRSPKTKRGYVYSLKRYMNYLKLTEVDDLLLHQEDKKLIESQLIKYIMSLRQDGLSHATMKYMVAPIITYYQLHDVIINRKKINRYFGEYKRVVKDQAYTTEQIQQALQNTDHRMRMIILLLLTGCRVGALPSLTLGNLTKLPDYDLYRVVFYESTNNEYYSFTTRECAQTGIDNYLLYRQRCGEKLSFNQRTNRWEPEDTPLIRQSFDMNDSFQAARQVKPMALESLRWSLSTHLIKCGLRQPEHPTEHKKRVRKSIALANGFRKHVIGTFIEAGLNHEIRELLVDHATGLDASYFRPSEKQVLEEYLKAEPLLTISPENRLQERVKTLTVERDSFLALRAELDELKKVLQFDSE